jgi:glycosyltransferase involved in cell wall biosynthesis
MSYHIVLTRSIDFETIEQQATAGERPRHVMWALSQKLDATYHAPQAETILPIDRVRSRLIGEPALWALARRLSEQLTSQDVVYCTGEAIGIPLATLCANRPDRPRIVVFIHGIHRPRARASLLLFQSAQHIDLFITNCQSQIDVLRQFAKVPESKILFLAEQTDTQFFTPGTPSPGKSRPLIVSVGLERRDYRLLARAIADLDVDVRISGFSADVRPSGRSFPRTMPANMQQDFYSWTDLVQLYRDADLMVLPLFETPETSGVTTLMEAMACACPIIASRTQGLADYLKHSTAIVSVEPGNLQQLRAAIVQGLAQPRELKTQANRAYELAQKEYNSERHVEVLATQLVLV